MNYDSYGGYDPLEAMRSRSQAANPYVDTPAPPEPAAGGAPQPPASPTTSPQQAALRTVTSPFRFDRRFSQGVSTPYYAAAGVGGVTDTGQLQASSREPNAYPGVQAAQAAPTGGSSGTGASSSWNTDGYATPQYTASTPGGVMSGWDATKWADPNHQTPKYVVGRILSKYPHTVEGLRSAMTEIQQAYPGATWNGKDLLTLPGGGPMDVLRGAGAGGLGWQWLDPSKQGAAKPAPATPGAGLSQFGNRFTPTQAEENPHATLLGWLLSQYLGV